MYKKFRVVLITFLSLCLVTVFLVMDNIGVQYEVMLTLTHSPSVYDIQVSGVKADSEILPARRVDERYQIA